MADSPWGVGGGDAYVPWLRGEAAKATYAWHVPMHAAFFVAEMWRNRVNLALLALRFR